MEFCMYVISSKKVFSCIFFFSTQSRSRLRLAASLAMLKLVQNVNFVDVITLEQYQQLALLMQVSCSVCLLHKPNIDIVKVFFAVHYPLTFFCIDKSV